MEDGDMEDHFPYVKRMRKPYRLLFDPVSGRGVAYDHGHRVIADQASAELIAFALDRHVLKQPWDDDKDRFMPMPRPAWVPAGSLRGWHLYWLRDERSTAQHLRDTPDR